jgi:hypothetical protein
LQFEGEHKGLYGWKQDFAGIEPLRMILEESGMRRKGDLLLALSLLLTQ